jgi:PIN domain nuclease of toxin-antitoxin system
MSYLTTAFRFRDTPPPGFLHDFFDVHSGNSFPFTDEFVSRNVHGLMEDEQHEKYVSIASVWELALSQPLKIYMPNVLHRNGFLLLPISLPHALHISKLPFHHKDPFDRLLIAQSLLDAMPLVSTDAVLDAYGVTRLW